MMRKVCIYPLSPELCVVEVSGVCYWFNYHNHFYVLLV